MKIYAAINAVQRDLALVGVSKAQYNDHDRYHFRGIDDVYNALSPALARAGLVILPRVTSREMTERTARSGGALYHVVLGVEFDFICADDGSKHTVFAYGEAMDRSDKATPKALTAAYKYCCFQVFCIPTEGSADPAASSPEALASPPPGLSPAQLEAVLVDIKEAGADLPAFCAHFGVASVADLDAEQLALASSMLARKKAKAKRAKLASAADLNAAL